MTTAKQIGDALDTKYKQRHQAQSRSNEEWIALREARSGPSFDGNRRQCDYLAIHTWKSRGVQLVGHEIKVSMADWKRELEDPDKAEMFAQYCRRWWVVMPSDIASKVKPEIPPSWGLMSVSDKGRVTETVKAPARKPKAVPELWWIGWMSQLDRRNKRGVSDAIRSAVAEQLGKERQTIDDRVQAQVDRRMSRVESALAMVDMVKEETGLDLYNVLTHHLKRLGQLWRLTHDSQVDLAYLARQLRGVESVAAMLEEIASLRAADQDSFA